ncbi:MAG TPA: enoyl-ACP reductase FabV, partial [Lachnospiraceae bacterium]
MIVKPKVREYICTTAHPLGCRENVRLQKELVKAKGNLQGPKKVLIIGASTGYGLSSRIMSAFGCKASTLGIMFERPANEKRTATAGWYNTWAFEEFAKEEGLYARTINGDAFSKEIKEETIRIIKEDLKEVDLVIYSLAAPRRIMPDGRVAVSSLRTTDTAFTEKNLDLRTNEVNQKTVEAATQEELCGTIDVMGGGDWKDWIDALKDANVLAENAVTVAYSYIGPKLTYPIYYNGTIGAAKKDLHRAQEEICKKYQDVQAYVSVNKALVTQ